MMMIGIKYEKSGEMVCGNDEIVDGFLRKRQRENTAHTKKQKTQKMGHTYPLTHNLSTAIFI